MNKLKRYTLTNRLLFAKIQRMNSAIISAKYQIVIPRELRKQLHLRPGQKVSFSLNKARQLVVESPEDALRELRAEFSGRNIWGDDPVSYIRRQRDAWDD